MRRIYLSIPLIIIAMAPAWVFPMNGYCDITALPRCNPGIPPEDINENIYGAASFSKTGHVMVGSRGKIYRSLDKGISWYETASGSKKTLYSVSFPDVDNGWISGQGGMILRTENSGGSWVAQKTGTGHHLFAITFSDARHGCAVGDWGTILATDDGGATWRDCSLPDDVLLYDVCFTDKENGVTVGEFGSIFMTADGGRTWKRSETPRQSEASLFCLDGDNNALYAAGLDGLILYSRDRGATWHRAVNATVKSLYGIAVCGGTGWAVGDAGTVIQTMDAGETWQDVAVPDHFKLFWLKVVNVHNGNPQRSLGFFAGAKGVYVRLAKDKILW